MAASFTENPILSPEALFTLSGNILAGPTFQQGIGAGVQSLGTIMAANKEKAKAAEEENRTRAYLQQQYPDQDFSAFTGDTLKSAANVALTKKLNPAQPDFKVLPDGTFGTWDGTKFNTLGRAQKEEDLPAAYKDWQLQQKDPAYREHSERTSKTGQTFEERKRIAQELGITETDERYQPYIATGKFPREDQQRMTAGDKSQLYELQDKIDANKTVISNLESLITPSKPGEKTLNDRAGSGYWAKTQAFIARNDPTGLSDSETGEATTEFDNVITQNTLGSLKAVFGSNPTEGERAAIRDLEASVDKTPSERKIIIERAMALAKRRLSDTEQRKASILDESFYQPGNTTRQPTTSGKTTTGNTWEALD